MPAAAPPPQQQPAQSSRQAAEEARKDRTLAEFLLMLDDYEPLVRDVSLFLAGLLGGRRARERA